MKNPEHALGHTSNAHINQIQGDTIGLYFAQTTHKGTKDFKIQVLEFISLPQNSEQALNLCLQKEKFWLHRLRCSDPQHHEVITWAQHQLAKTPLY